MRLEQLSERLQKLTVNHSDVQQWPPEKNDKSAIFCEHDSCCVATIIDSEQTNFIDRDACILDNGITMDELRPFLHPDYKTVFIQDETRLESFSLSLHEMLWNGNF